MTSGWRRPCVGIQQAEFQSVDAACLFSLYQLLNLKNVPAILVFMVERLVVSNVCRYASTIVQGCLLPLQTNPSPLVLILGRLLRRGFLPRTPLLSSAIFGNPRLGNVLTLIHSTMQRYICTCCSCLLSAFHALIQLFHSKLLLSGYLSHPLEVNGPPR